MNGKKIIINCLLIAAVFKIIWEFAQVVWYQNQMPNSEEIVIVSQDSDELKENLIIDISEVQTQFEILEQEIAKDYLSCHYLDYYDLFRQNLLENRRKTLFPSLLTANLDERRAELLTLPLSCLNETQKDDYYQILRFFEIQQTWMGLPDYKNLLAPTYGCINRINEWLSNVPLNEETDIQNYLEVFSLIPEAVEQICERIQNQIVQGNYPTSYCIEIALQQCQSLQENEFYKNVWENNLEQMTGLLSEQKTRYAKKREEIVQNELIPAWIYLQCFLNDMDDSKEGEGLAQKSKGLEYYENLLREQVGIDESVEVQIAYLEQKQSNLLKEVQQLMEDDSTLAQWYVMGAELSNPFDSAEAFIEYLKDKTKQNFPVIEQKEYRIVLRNADTLLPNIVAYYTRAPLDSSMPDTITINEQYMVSSMSLYLTLAHETYPGHMYLENYMSERAKEKETEQILEYIRPLTGYKEGWATYVSLKALDWLEEDSNKILLYRDLYLLNETFVCLADLYINGKGWNQLQIAQYYEHYYGDNMAQDEIEELYQSCVAEPGLYLPYMEGCYQWMDMEQLWNEQKENRGENFVQIVLSMGKLPYEMLWEKLEEYLNKNSGDNERKMRISTNKGVSGNR